MKAAVSLFSALGLTTFFSSQFSTLAFEKFVPVPNVLQKQQKRNGSIVHRNLLDGSCFQRSGKCFNNHETQLQALPSVMTNSMAAGCFLRGGAEVLNLAQESYHMQSLATYSTVTALIMNAALRLYSSTKFPSKKDAKMKKVMNYMYSVFLFTTALCIISGTFTAVLFNILGLYRKSALGSGNHEGYLAFKLATHSYSRLGFRSFLTTCCSFIGSFILSLSARVAENDDFKPDMCILVAASALTLISAFKIKAVINLATSFIYHQ